MFLATPLALALLLAPQAARGSSELEAGFHTLYNLQFDAAQKQFQEYQRRNPADPLGFAAEAAGLAFQEFHRLGLLTSRNFLGDRPQADGSAPKPDEVLSRRFHAAMDRAQNLAQQRLLTNPGDQNALFAMALTGGLHADYTYLVERQGWASLKLVRDAESTARRLLEINPDYYDAYLALGALNYILANLPIHQRLFLRVAGISGDKRRAFTLMESVAQRGGLLAPFARILLALMCLREQETARARRLLLELQEQFPLNSIFPTELALLDHGAARAGGHRP